MSSTEYTTEQQQSYQVNQNEKDTLVSLPLSAITRNNSNNDPTLQYTSFSPLYTNNDYNHSYVSPLSPRSPMPQYIPTTPTSPYASTSYHIPHHTSIQHSPTMQCAPIPQYTQYESMPQSTPMSQSTPMPQYTPIPQMTHHGINGINNDTAPAMQYSPPYLCSNCSIPMQQYGHVIQNPQCYPQVSAPMPIQQFACEAQQFYNSLYVTSPRIPPQTRMNDSENCLSTVPVPVGFDVYYVPRFNQRRNCSEKMLPHRFQNTYEPALPQQERVRSCPHICPHCN